MREVWSETAGGYLRFLDLPGTDLPIVFIHGLGCAGSYDFPQVAAQPELSSHRRILIDLLGAGYSDRPEGFGYRVTDHADVLAELVDRLDLGRFVLFAHSAGGAIALEVAHRVGDQLAGLVLSESNLDPSQPGAASYGIASQSEAEFIAHGFDELVDDCRRDGVQRWAAPLAHWSPTAAWRLSTSLKAGQTPNGRQVLYDLDVPSAYLIGEQSLPDPDVAELPRHGIEVFTIPQAGHSMAWENPEGVAAAIAAALRGR